MRLMVTVFRNGVKRNKRLLSILDGGCRRRVAFEAA